MVIGHRFGENRERGRLGIDRKWGRVEAKVGNRIYLEDRIAGGNRGGGGVSGAGSSGAVVESRRRILRAFFKAWPSRFLLYQESGEEARELRRSGRCTTIYHGASFGEAAFANMSKDKAYLIFL